MTKFMRIAMLAPFGIRPKGTLAVRMLPLAQALVRRGHSVHIVAPPVHNPQDAGTCINHAGVPVTHIPLPSLPGPAGTLQVVITLLRQALHPRPDLLHLFKPKGYSGLAALLARQLYPTVPLIVDTDDWEGWGGWNDLLPYPRIAKTVFAWQERDLPHRANAVTVASRTLETQIWGFGVPPAQVFYLPNGVLQSDNAHHTRNPDARATGTTSHHPTLLLYTRFWEFDLRDLIVALVAIVAQVPTVRLLVVGRGERGEEGELLHLARRAGIARAVDYRGWVEPEAIPALLTAADIALVPLDDTLINRARCSVKLLELMAAGLPVVAGRVGQVSEYIEDRQSGLLVPPGDPAALARATLLLLEDANLRQQLSSAARSVVKTFTWEQIAPMAEQAYAYSCSSIS